MGEGVLKYPTKCENHDMKYIQCFVGGHMTILTLSPYETSGRWVISKRGCGVMPRANYFGALGAPGGLYRKLSARLRTRKSSIGDVIGGRDLRNKAKARQQPKLPRGSGVPGFDRQRGSSTT